MFGGQPFYLGHLGKTPVYVAPDAVLNLLLVWMICDQTLPGFIIVAMALLTVILIHEAGHASIARLTGMYGVTIVISAFGGFCTYAGDPPPKLKLPISLAGPVANLLTAAGVWLILTQVPQFNQLNPLIVSFAGSLLSLSLVLGLFNLLPIYPLDGGQATLAVSRMVARSDGSARRFTLSLTVAAVPAVLAIMYVLHIPIGMLTLFILAMLLMSAFRDLR